MGLGVKKTFFGIDLTVVMGGTMGQFFLSLKRT